ncbi:CopG family transcriptional regulator [Candidatus Poriferisocius sp.]|uniref:CopG family transcriptional regulator n=1 Tax=Candidatus Poriferisocius sp. TaxID=3101276 RepID=UPI003B012F80
MRTTITLAADVAAAVEGLRRCEGIGVSEAVNRLARDGLAKPNVVSRYQHASYEMGERIDISNIGEVLGLLDEES